MQYGEGGQANGIGVDNARHQRHGNGIEEQGRQRDEAGNSGAETAAAGEEAGEEGRDGKEQADDVEDPSKAPHVKVKLGRRIAGKATADSVWDVLRVVSPGVTERHRGARLGAVDVVRAANVEVGPLRDGAGAGDAAGVGLEEVGTVQRCGVLGAGEDDEEDHDYRTGEEHKSRQAECWICAGCQWPVSASWLRMWNTHVRP